MNSSNKKVEKLFLKLRDECLSIKSKISNENCERVFDGYFCWPETRPGKLATQNCTNDFFQSINKIGEATKQCTENGTWYIKEKGSHKHWTNFSQCGNFYILDREATKEANETVQLFDTWNPFITEATYVGYGMSTISLIIALVIFITLRRLHCERNKLHINLFISHLLRAFMHFAKKMLFIYGLALKNDIIYDDDKLVLNYTWKCKLFVSFQCYARLTNFMFMLMEGMYLHNLIFLNLISESHGTTIYCIFGWVTPIFFVILWALLRLFYEDTYCWNNTDSSFLGLVTEIPVGIAIIVNFILFTVILRVLVMKIHFTSTFIQHKKIKYRKLLKSTLILIPLYGIPYTVSLILSFCVTKKSNMLQMIWLLFDQTFTSFQGLFAALVYCLLNSDVRIEVLRKYCLLLNQANKKCPRSRTISSNTQQFSLQNDETLENLTLFGIVDDETARKAANADNST